MRLIDDTPSKRRKRLRRSGHREQQHDRHCERSEAIQKALLDRHAAALLAMMGQRISSR
jgi:hypothetical protein